MRTLVILSLACLALPGIRDARAGTPCMVLGQRSARVAAVEGVRSPVFETRSCARLRLVSGVALASWVDSSGKPRLVPITPSGVAAVPKPGSEERSVKVAWAQITTTRAAQQPAFMRGMDDDHAVPVYVPIDGLTVAAAGQAPAQLRIGHDHAAASTVTVPAGKAVILQRDALLPGQRYTIAVERDGHTRTLRWRIVTAAEQHTIDARLQALRAQLPEARQRRIVAAMLFDQLKLETNVRLLGTELRRSTGTGPGTGG